MPYRRITTTEEPASKRADRRESQDANLAPPSHPLVSLQSHVGNRQVARMLAQRQEGIDEEEMQAKHDRALAQRQEGEMEDEELQAKHDAALLQRAGPDDEEIALKRDPAVGLEGGPVGDAMTRTIDASRGSGSSLSPSIQGKMEGAMGSDFSGVKVHHDESADALTRNMTAKAFTTGSDIFLRRDQNPNDQNLLAHELTHVVQQSSGRTAAGGGAMTVGAADHADEHEADAVAAAVTSGQTVDRKLEESRA
ncbi:MAG: DUF4157 domain-containing protein [Dehalococcoidia bacterium]